MAWWQWILAGWAGWVVFVVVVLLLIQASARSAVREERLLREERIREHYSEEEPDFFPQEW